MLDRIIKQAEKIVEQNLRIKELEQQLAVVQEREATRDHPPIDQAKEDDENLPEIPQGFIRHDGGEHPFSGSKNVIVIYRDGRQIINFSGCICPWKHSGASYDIIAYKVIEE